MLGCCQSSEAYAYDGSGQRVWQQATQQVGPTTTTTTITYVLGVEEVTTTAITGQNPTTATTSYYPLPGGVSASRDASGLVYQASDVLGTPIAALNLARGVVGEQLRAPYGQARYAFNAASNGGLHTTFGFTGQREDTQAPGSSGLDYFGARYYDPVIGRFTSADSVHPALGDPVGLDNFGYVGGQVESTTDPSGQRPTECETADNPCVPAPPDAPGDSVRTIPKGVRGGNPNAPGGGGLVEGGGLLGRAIGLVVIAGLVYKLAVGDAPYNQASWRAAHPAPSPWYGPDKDYIRAQIAKEPKGQQQQQQQHAGLGILTVGQYLRQVAEQLLLPGFGEPGGEPAPEALPMPAGAGAGQRGGGRICSGNYWTPGEFRGQTVYQRNDLIDPNLVGPDGRTNLERMLQGNPPIGPDGEPMQLHHMLQMMDGPLAEVTRTFHQTNKLVININPDTIPSGIDRDAFKPQRQAYWKARGMGYLGFGQPCLFP